MENAIYKSNITLIDKVYPRSYAYRTMVLVTLGAVITAIGAQITIPWIPVPFTLQPLAVLLCGLTFGAKRGALSQITYLVMGIAGLPVFAEGGMGIAKIVGPTGGYLIAFIVAAYVVGRLAEKQWDRTPIKLFCTLLIGNAIILGMGTLWLSKFFGFKVAFSTGCLPFISCDIVKDLIVMGLLPKAWKAVEKI